VAGSSPEKDRERGISGPFIVLAVQRPYSARRQPWGALGVSLKKSQERFIAARDVALSLSLFLLRARNEIKSRGQMILASRTKV